MDPSGSVLGAPSVASSLETVRESNFNQLEQLEYSQGIKLFFFEMNDLVLDDPMDTFQKLLNDKDQKGLLTLLRLEDFTAHADSFLDYLEENKTTHLKISVDAKSGRELLHTFTHLIINLFIASNRDVFPNDLIDIRPHSKNVLLMLYKIDLFLCLNKLDAINRPANFEERLEKIVLIIKQYDQIFSLTFPNELNPLCPVNSEILKGYIRETLPISPTLGQQIKTLDRENLERLPLGFKNFWNDELLKDFFLTLGFLPTTATSSMPTETRKQMKMATLRMVVGSFPQLLQNENFECDYSYKGKTVIVHLDVLDNAISVYFSKNAPKLRKAYVHDRDGLDRYIDRVGALRREKQPCPNDPILCYLANSNEKVPALFNEFYQLPICFSRNQHHTKELLNLNVLFYCFIRHQWTSLSLNSLTMHKNWLLEPTGEIYNFRTLIEYYLHHYRLCYSHALKRVDEKFHQTCEIFQKGWPGITILRMVIKTNLWRAIQSASAQTYIIGDPITNRYIFRTMSSFGTFSLILPWNNEEKTKVLAQLHQLFQYPLNLNVNAFQGYIKDDLGVIQLIHDEPADVQISDLLNSFRQIRRAGGFDSIPERQMATSTLAVKFEKVVRIVFEEKGLEDLNPEENRDSYRRMKIMFTRVYESFQESPDGLNQFFYDIGKHEGYCSHGLMKELGQWYKVRFLDKIGDQTLTENRTKKSAFSKFLKDAALSMIDALQSVARDQKALQQSIHVRNFLHSQISLFVELPQDPANQFGGASKSDGFTAPTTIGLDFFEDGKPYVTEFSQELLLPTLVTHFLTMWNGLILSSKGAEFLKLLKEFVRDVKDSSHPTHPHLVEEEVESDESDSASEISRNETAKKEINALREKIDVYKQEIDCNKGTLEFKIFSSTLDAFEIIKSRRNRAKEKNEEIKTLNSRYKQLKSDVREMKKDFAPLSAKEQELHQLKSRLDSMSKSKLNQELDDEIQGLINRGLLEEHGDEGIYYTLTVRGAIAWLSSKGVVFSPEESMQGPCSSSSSISFAQSALRDDDDSVSSSSLGLTLVDDDLDISPSFAFAPSIQDILEPFLFRHP